MALMRNWLVMTVLLGPSVAAQIIHSRAETTVFGTCVGSGPFSDVSSILGNPAILPAQRSFSAALFGTRCIRLPEIARNTAAFWVQAGRGGFSGHGHLLSFSGFSESAIGLNYGRQMSDRLQAGVRFNHHGIRFPDGYGRAGTFSADAGLLLHLTDRFRMGLLAVNPLGKAFFGSSSERMGSVYASGVGYQASDVFDWSMELRKEEGHAPELRVAMTYRPVSRLDLAGGFSSLSGAGWFRAGFFFSKWRFDLLMQQHPHLGLSPGLALQYKRGK